MMSEPVAVQGDASLVTSTVTSDPESTSINNNNNNNNVSNNNNNNSPAKGLGGKKVEGKLPPCSSISNNSFLWDPAVDGELVNMPLAPQLITEVPPGDELNDLTELIGPELATLVTATPDHKSMTIIHTTDGGHFPVDVANSYNPDNFTHNIDFEKLWGDYTASEQQHQHHVNTGPHSTQKPTVLLIRKGKEGHGHPGHPGLHQQPHRSEDNNNNNNNNNSEIVRGNNNELVIGIGEPGGSKALLLQHRDSRSDTGGGPSQQGEGRSVVTSRTASGDSVTLTVVKGDPGGMRGRRQPGQWSVLAVGDINAGVLLGVATGPSTPGYGAPVLARRQLTAPVMSGQS